MRFDQLQEAVGLPAEHDARPTCKFCGRLARKDAVECHYCGRRYAPEPKADVVSSPEFQRWFAGSRVVDREGRPLVVYHATRTAPTRFKNLYGLGIYGHFGTLESAHDKAEHDREEGKAGGASIMPLYLAIRNPLRMSDIHFDQEYGAWAEELVKRRALTKDELPVAYAERYAYRPGKADARLVKELVEKLKAKGYDGIVYANRIEGVGDSWIPFYPTQIKSAIANRRFNPRSPSITESITPDAGPQSYWHGTTADAARGIAREGLLKPSTAKRTARLAPMAGHVYLSTTPSQGVGHALFYAHMRDPKAREAGLVEVDKRDLQRYTPDEDELADALSTYHLYGWGWVTEGGARWPIAWSRMTKEQQAAAPAYDRPSPLPAERKEEFEIGRSLYQQYVEHDARLAGWWRQTMGRPDYERFTQIAKGILRRTRKERNNPLLQQIAARSERMAHEGAVRVKRVLILRYNDQQAKDIGADRSGQWDQELLAQAEELPVAATAAD